jgi:beta-glucuronidase
VETGATGFTRGVSTLTGVFVFFLFLTGSLFAEETPSNADAKELVRQAWALSGQSDYKNLNETIDNILKQYEVKAEALSSTLQGFPAQDKFHSYEIMNAVATVLFIRAESLMRQGRNDQAIASFKDLIKNYPYAQAWDPSRGSYWSIADKSLISINEMTGEEEKAQEIKVLKTKPGIFTHGTDKVVDYTKYGTFSGIGTKDFKFEVNNPNILAKAVGEGIYPNTEDIFKNPGYSQVFKDGRLKGNHWDFVNISDLEAAYFKWTAAPEDPGVKLFYTGFIFEKAKMYFEAIKAYHAVIVHFPATVSWTYWHTKWYPAQVAVAKIKFIIRMHPELNIQYKGGKVQVINEGDQVIVATDPGIVKYGQVKKKKIIKDLGKPVRFLGGKKTQLVQYANGHWRILVDGKPFFIKGITYLPTKVGESPDDGTLDNWMTQDTNHNGKPDGPYDSYVDKNDKNKQHSNEVVVGDFQLLKEMGANTLRLYQQPFKPVKSLLRDLYKRYGIRVLMGDYLGKYAFGSGADWATGTDYENPVQQANMLKTVEELIKEFKDEPYILMWVLGNENNYGVSCNGNSKPDAFYKFVNKVAQRIKEIDPDRPVAMVNGDVLYIDKFAANAPDIDVFSANVYRGDYGFGPFWSDVQSAVNKPVYITEYGAPGYSNQKSIEEMEEEQAFYDQGNWMDILENSAGYPDGEGNSIGGVAFEWVDEWYKSYGPWSHETKADATGPFPGGYYFEEWFGITGQGDGKNSPFLRHLKKAYFMYKKHWNN